MAAKEHVAIICSKVDATTVVPELVNDSTDDTPIYLDDFDLPEEVQDWELSMGVMASVQFVLGSDAEEPGELVEVEDENTPPVDNIDISTPPKPSKRWGPVQPTRISKRIPKDGKTILDRAKELKEAKNLGTNVKGILKNSFASCSNSADVSCFICWYFFGPTPTIAMKNINQVKKFESVRLQDFHHDHPDMFLPR